MTFPTTPERVYATPSITSGNKNLLNEAPPPSPVLTFASSSGVGGAPFTYLTLTLLTQCLSIVGVKPSFSKTWPRWPSHAAHKISVGFEVRRVGKDKIKEKRQLYSFEAFKHRGMYRWLSISSSPKPTYALHAKSGISLSLDTTLVALIEGRPATTRVELGLSRVQGIAATLADEVPLVREKLVVFSSSSWLRPLLTQHLK